MRGDDKVRFRLELLDHAKVVTKLICFSLILMMYMVTFSPIVDKYYSEVGEPSEGATYNDWVIEPGDRVVRENEVLKLYGDLIIMPGGNLTLRNCEVYFHEPFSGRFILHVQKDTETGECGELSMDGTTVSVFNQSGGYYYDFQIEGNASINGCDISYVGSYGTEGGLMVLSDNVTITNSKIHDNECFGIYVSSNPVIMNNDIYSNYYGIYFHNSTGEGALIRDNEGDNRFGSFVSCSWDINNDAYHDIVISAPYDDTAYTNAGAVYIFYGNPARGLTGLVPFDADIKLFGRSAGALFGKKIDLNGDLNGDGAPDLVISAPGAKKVYVYFNNLTGFGGLVRNETVAQFESGSMSNMEIISGGSVGNGRLVLIGDEETLTWDLNKSSDRSTVSDMDFWSDGLSISFPSDYLEYSVSPIEDYCTGYFSFEEDRNETLGEEETGIGWVSTYFDDETTEEVLVDGKVGKGIYFDGVDDRLELEPDDDPFEGGNGTIDLWFSNPGNCDDDRSDLDTQYRKFVVGMYSENLTYPEWGLVIDDERLYVETYEVDGEYEQLEVYEVTKVDDATLDLPVDQFEILSDYDGLVQTADNNPAMEGSQSNIYYSAYNAFRCNGNSWKEWSIGQYYLNESAEFNFRLRCDTLGEIAAIGIANGTGSSRNELLYYLGGTDPFETPPDMGEGNWINDGSINPNGNWYLFSFDIFSDWYSMVNSTDLGFDRIIFVCDDDLPPEDGMFYVDNLNFTDVYHFEEDLVETRDVLNGTIDTLTVLEADDIIEPNRDHHVRIYFKNHYAFLEVNGEVRDIIKLSSAMEDKFDFDTGSDFFVLAQRPRNDLAGPNPPDYDYNVSDSYTTFSNFHGWIDELLFYTIPVEQTPIDPREGGFYPYKTDLYTELLLHLDEKTGSVIHNDFYYTCYNNTFSKNSIGFIDDGYFGGCGEFSTNSPYINCGNRYNLSKGTFEAYLSLSSAFSSSSSTNLFLLYKQGPTTSYLKLYFDESTGRLVFTIRSGSIYTVWSDRTSWSADRWYHVAVTWGDGMKMYVDGVLQYDTDSFSGFCGNADTNLLIGATMVSYQYTQFFQGKMDEVRLSTVPRSEFPTLTYFMTRRENEVGPETVFLAHFNEGSGSVTAEDRWSNSGTIYSSTWSDGQFGRCLSFGGSSGSYVSYSTSTYGYALGSELSVDAWIYPVSGYPSGNNYIVSRANSYALVLNKAANGDLFLKGMIYQSGEQWSDATTACHNFKNQLNRWYHVGMVYDTQTKKISMYIDGRLDSETTISPADIPEASSPIEVGKNFKGYLDEVRISSVRKDGFDSEFGYDFDRVTQFSFDEGKGFNSLNRFDSDQKAVLFDGDEYGLDWVEGHTGYGIDLDGVDDHVWINDSGFDYISNELTLSMYIKIPQTLTGTRYVLAGKVGVFNVSIVKSGSDYNLVGAINHKGTWYSTSVPDEAPDLNDLVGTWVKVGFALNENKLCTFVNGRFNGQVYVSFMSFTGAGTLYLGRDSTGNYFKGTIDDFMVARSCVVNNIRYRSEVITTIKGFTSPVRITSVAIPGSVPAGTAIKYQVRFGNSTEEVQASSWQGPTGSSSFYHSGHSDYDDTGEIARYVQVKVLIESDSYGLTPHIYRLDVNGIGYHTDGHYSSEVTELPDWVDRIVPEIGYVLNSRSVTYTLGYSLDGQTWYNVTMSNKNPLDFAVYSTKFLRYYIDVANSSWLNGAFTPEIDSVRFWYEFEAGMGSLEISSAQEEFGRSFSSSGDHNGDGYSDLVIGSPSEKKVYIYYGGGAMDTVSDCVITSDLTGFGTNLTSVPDYTGDGYDELAVVSSGSSSVRFYSGSDLAGSISSTLTEDVISGSGSFGSNVFVLGDLTGDKFDEIGISSGDRYFRIFSSHDLYISEDLTSSDHVCRIDAGEGSCLGHLAVGDFDLNGDTLSDLVLTDVDQGKAYVFSGSVSLEPDIGVADAVYTYYSTGEGSGFGESAGAGDINGDGFIEFMLGESHLDTACEGSGAVRSLGPSTGRVSGNTVRNNQYGMYFESSQQGLKDDILFENRYNVYSLESTLALAGVRIGNSTSGHDHLPSRGLYVSGGFVQVRSSDIFTMDGPGIENHLGVLYLYDVKVDQSVSRFEMDYSISSLDEIRQNVEIDSSSVKLIEVGSDQVFLENWSSVDTEGWNQSVTGAYTCVSVNNTWSGSGSDLKMTCAGTVNQDAEAWFHRTIEFDDGSVARDYVLESRFVLQGVKSNFTSGSMGLVSFRISKDDGGSSDRTLVFSAYDGSLLGSDPNSTGWRDYGDSMQKIIVNGSARTYYRVSNRDVLEMSLNDPLLEMFGTYFREDNTDWTEIDNITIDIHVKEKTYNDMKGTGFNPIVYLDQVKIKDPEYKPVYYTSGYIISDNVTRPANNDWDELFVDYQDPNDITSLKLYLLDQTGSVLAQVGSVPFDLSCYGSYSKLRFKAQFQGNSLSTSRLTKWGISFRNTNDSSLHSSGGQVSLRSCLLSSNVSIDLKLEDGCHGTVIDTAFEDDKMTVTGTGSVLDRFCRVRVETYPDIHPYMDPGFHHDTSPFVDFVITDIDHDEVFSGFTNATGKLDGILIKESSWTGSGIEFKGPFHLIMDGGNNVSFIPALTKRIWVRNNSLDSDADFILDSQETREDVLWFEGEDLALDSKRLSSTWDACGELALEPDSDLEFCDRYFPLPGGSDDGVKVMFRAGPSDKVPDRTVTLSIDGVDGFSCSTLLNEQVFRLSSRFRFYQTDILDLPEGCDGLRIRVTTDNAEVLLDSVVIIRSDTELGGLLTNPIMMDSDKDLIIDGVEQRDGTRWFEAEFFGTGSAQAEFSASSGFGIRNETGQDLISSIPVVLDEGTEYRFYFRGRSTQAAAWEMFDDFDDSYYSDQSWEHIPELNENDGSSNPDWLYSGSMYQYLDLSQYSTDQGREVFYTVREFRTNSTFEIGYRVSTDILFGKDCRMVVGVVDGNDTGLRAEFAMGYSQISSSLRAFDETDFVNSSLMMISDGKELGLYRKNGYGVYNMIGSADVRSFSSYRLFIGITTCNFGPAYGSQGRIILYTNNITVKEENLKLQVTDAGSNLVMEKCYSLDNKYRWNHLNFTPDSTGTYYLKALCNAEIGLVGDKAMVCNMSQVAQYRFFDGVGDVDSLTLSAETDFDYENGYYTCEVDTASMPGTSFVTSGLFRVRTDLTDIDPVDGFSGSSSSRDAPSIYGNYIVWTSGSAQRNLTLKDMTSGYMETFSISNKDLRNASIHGNYVVIETWDKTTGLCPLTLLEINSTIALSTPIFKSLNIPLDHQTNPHLFGDRIVFEGSSAGSDKNIFVYDLDIDDDGVFNFYEPGFGVASVNDSVTDSDDDVDEDPLDFLDNDGDGLVDEDRDYNGLYELNLSGSEHFADEDRDQVKPRINGDRVVFLDEYNGGSQVWLVSLVKIKPFKGQFTEACLKVNATSLISDRPVNSNLRLTASKVVYLSTEDFKRGYYETEEKNVIAVYDLVHNRKQAIPMNISSFDVSNENLVYSTLDHVLGTYDLNVMINHVLLPDHDSLSPAISGNTFCWLNQTGNSNEVSFFSQHFTVSSGSTISSYLETTKVIPLDELTSDFGPDVLSYLYGKTSDDRFTFVINSTQPLDITIDHLDIQLEFIMDPLDPDTDYDDVTDGEEVVTFAGVSILECEDARSFKPWSPISSTTEFLAVDNEDVRITAGYGFFQPRSVSLITSRSGDAVADSWIALDYVPDKTGIYRLSLNYPVESRTGSFKGTMVPGNMPKTELTPQGTLTVTDLDLNSSSAGYYESVLSESFEMTVRYSYSELNPLQYGSGSTYRSTVNVRRACNVSTYPGIPGDTVIIGEVTAEGQWRLSAGITYTVLLSMDMTRTTTGLPSGVIDPDRLTLQNLDYIRIDFQGLDPMNIDSDNDGIEDGIEAFNATMYALSSDPDHDGISDSLEFEYGTCFGDRDTDGDGIRDAVELGLSAQFIEFFNGDVNSSGSYFERIARSGDHSPFNFTLIPNHDADNGATVTDPLDPDTDKDGLPDGWIDGWYYGDEVFPRLYRTSNDGFWDRYDNLDYWEYQPWKWGKKMHPDNIRQVYEGEDLNLDGKTEPQSTVWSFDPYTFETVGVGETNGTEPDSDYDGMDDGYEVWYSHLWPYFIYRNGTVEGLDPTRYDSGKDIDGVDVLWDVGLMEGESDPGSQSYSMPDPMIPKNQNYTRRATNDLDFAQLLGGLTEPQKITGFVQRLELKAGDIQDADFIEVKAEFYRSVYVEIWEGRDEDYMNQDPHLVYPERCVFSRKLPSTHSDDGWIKIPLDGRFNYNQTITSSSTAPPVYFLVIKNSDQAFSADTGFVWSARVNNDTPCNTLLYCDSTFGGAMTPWEWREYLDAMVNGIPPENITQKMFRETWYYLDPDLDPDEVMNLTNYQRYSVTFGYRFIDLDKESIVLDVPRFDEDWEDDYYPFYGSSHKIGVKLANFTLREMVNLSDIYFHVQTGSQGFNGNFKIMMGSPLFPDAPVGNYGQSPDQINLAGYYSGWLHFVVHSNSFNIEGMSYWLVFESSVALESQALRFTDTTDTLSGIGYKRSTSPGQWQSVTGFDPAFMVISDKFDSCEYGDGLSNLHEFIIGTHPKKENNDLIIIAGDNYDDELIDGPEIFAGGSSDDYSRGGVIYRTSFVNGSLSFEGYTGGSIVYDGDGIHPGFENKMFGFYRQVEDPSSGNVFCSKDLNLLLTLKDGSGVFTDEDFDQLFIWAGTQVIPDPQDGPTGGKYCPGTVAIYNRTNEGFGFDYDPIDRNSEIYFSDPFQIDTDQDGIPDGEEIDMFEDTDGDSKPNLRDTDSDGDGILDRQEIDWDQDSDGDGLENMIDPDSDNDGLLDGDEVSWNFDTDGDGLENMIDPDSDNDGLADGWIDGKIWDWNTKSFVNYSTNYQSTYGSTYYYPEEADGYFDPWEGEDTNMNGKHDRDEPDPTKPDTDGDSLWDGFDVYHPDDIQSKNERVGSTPLHFGELYSINYTHTLTDKGLPYSGGDQFRIAQHQMPSTTNIQMTSQVSADTDGDGLTDYQEILVWYLKVEDFVPAYELTATNYIAKCYFALNEFDDTNISSDPNDYDTDDDGLSDKDEYLFTNPLDKDTDNDGLPDRMENWHNFGVRDMDETNPCDRDTDNDGAPDGWSDGWDLSGSSPVNAVDRILSGELVYNATDSESAWSGLASSSNRCEFGECRVTNGEYEWVSNPLKADTDDDDIIDGIEFCYLWNVVHDPFADSDNDGKGDLFEKDSDYDGLFDGEENRDHDMFLDGWWALYKPNQTDDFEALDLEEEVPGAIWVDPDHHDLGYMVFHFNESLPTDKDCDDDGLLDSVEPQPFSDTDGDGYINVWDQNSNDCKGNGPGVGPASWGNGISTVSDSDEETNNSWSYDNCSTSQWALRDYMQTYVVFRTNATDVDGDRRIDYAVIELNYDHWISVDTIVNLWKNENPTCSLSSSYNLTYSWATTSYLIKNIVSDPGSITPVFIYYDESAAGQPLNLTTVEGYQIYRNYDSSEIFIMTSVNEYVRCVKATGTAPTDYSDNIRSVEHFARNWSESIDGRPALDLDPDRDGILTPIEEFFGLNPNDADTDNDGIKDGDEPEWWNNSDGDDQFYSGYTGNHISINALDPDSDNDGLLDGTEMGVTNVHPHSRSNRASQGSEGEPHDHPVYIKSGQSSFDADFGATTTDMLDPDSDNDGILDGWDDENNDGYQNGSEDRGEDHVTGGFDNGDWGDGKINGDSNNNGYWDTTEKWVETSPNDMDSDDDGVTDNNETVSTNYWYGDFDGDGLINAVDPDSDDDGLYDALERGYKPGGISVDTNLNRPFFVPDTDHCTTDPYDTDTDNDDIKDGLEDLNRNGRIDGDNGDGIYQMGSEKWKETNPNSWDSDQDSIKDNIEKTHGYNPLSNDTDNDGLNDTEEDEDRNGVLDQGETDPKSIDTDKDGLQDKLEVDGWTVCIRYEATGEEKTHYTVYSDPTDPDSDDDGLSDFDEYKNVTDPWKPDTDGDGKTDIDELIGDFNSSATGIDGEPPTIWMFDCNYKISFDRYLGIKIPSGLKVSIETGVKDIFGLDYVKIVISGLPDVIKYCNNSDNITETFEWELTGIDQYARAFVKGFKINLTAMDRNGNIGFKNDELKSIAEIVVSSYLGALLSIVNFISELASGIFDWIYEAVTNSFNTLLENINDVIQFIKEYIQSFVEDIKQCSDSITFKSIIDDFLSIFKHPIMWVFFGIFTAITIALLLIKTVPVSAIVSIVISLIITILLVILMSSMGEEGLEDRIKSLINKVFDPEYDEESKMNTGEKICLWNNFITTGVLFIDLMVIIAYWNDVDFTPAPIYNIFSFVLLGLMYGVDLYGENADSDDVIASLVFIGLASLLLFLSYKSWKSPKNPPGEVKTISGIIIAINALLLVTNILLLIASKALWGSIFYPSGNGNDNKGGETEENFDNPNLRFKIIKYITLSQPSNGADPKRKLIDYKNPDPRISDIQINGDLIHSIELEDNCGNNEVREINYQTENTYKNIKLIIKLTAYDYEYINDEYQLNPTDNSIHIYKNKNSITLFYIYDKDNYNYIYIDDNENGDLDDYEKIHHKIERKNDVFTLNGEGGISGSIVLNIVNEVNQ